MAENQQQWFAVDVWLLPEAVDAIEFALNETGATGTELNLLGKKQTANEFVCLIGYFEEKPNAEILRAQISNALQIYDLPEAAIAEIKPREVENKDWLAEWKKHWKPTETEHFVVAPTWSEIGETAKTILRIEPGMAFGTGTHETTRLCLQAIEAKYQGESFFDVGTGTGVLAIAAAKWQSKFQSPKSEIVGCDTDTDSVKIAAENAAINGVAERIEFYVGSISRATPTFDFVVANLTADVIVPLLPLLIEKARKTLLLSGILSEQQTHVSSELSRLQISDFEVKTRGEWISILIER